MDATKIRLSAKEMALVTNAGIILTKNEILEKTKTLLGYLQSKYREAMVQSDLQPVLIQSSPKISKGEKYKGLPWLMLDYPRCFGRENIFAIRTMFWWGNFFSITLHLSGEFKKEYEQKLGSSHKFLSKKDFYIGLNKDPWEHHFKKENYLPISKMSAKEFETAIRERSFIKIANKVPVSKWDKAGKILYKNFNNLIQVVQ